MSLIEDLRLDPEHVTWEDFAACKGLDQLDENVFYDRYEDDLVIARQVDVLCSRCPVVKACRASGIENKEEGVWGGIYLSGGKVDKVKNKHKDPEIAQILNERTK